MLVPQLQGLIRRRILVNYRVDPQVMARFLPAPFRPKLQFGHAIAGICLIRLEQIRPAWLPPSLGFSSENAAHRVAVEWTEPSGEVREGVFIPRRDTSSHLNHLAGGRVFPGAHHLAEFEVSDDSSRLGVSVHSRDGDMNLKFRAFESSFHSDTACFRRLADASAFFEHGTVGYTPTSDPHRFDGIELRIEKWHVLPLSVEQAESSFFANEKIFPHGSAIFDHALLMRDVPHSWHKVPDMTSQA